MNQTRFSTALLVALGMVMAVIIGCEKESFTPEEEVALEENAALNTNELHVCIDKYLETEKQSPEKAAVIGAKLWTIGQTIRVRFLGGDAFV